MMNLLTTTTFLQHLLKSTDLVFVTYFLSQKLKRSYFETDPSQIPECNLSEQNFLKVIRNSSSQQRCSSEMFKETVLKLNLAKFKVVMFGFFFFNFMRLFDHVLCASPKSTRGSRMGTLIEVNSRKNITVCCSS